MRFGFKANNKLAKYEALLTGLQLDKKMQVKMLFINNKSQLVVSQVNSYFSAKDENNAAYLKLVMEFVLTFENFE